MGGCARCRSGSVRFASGGGRWAVRGFVVKIQYNNGRVVLSQLLQLPTLLETGRTDRWTERGGDARCENDVLCVVLAVSCTVYSLHFCVAGVCGVREMHLCGATSSVLCVGCLLSARRDWLIG